MYVCDLFLGYIGHQHRYNDYHKQWQLPNGSKVLIYLVHNLHYPCHGLHMEKLKNELRQLLSTCHD